MVSQYLEIGNNDWRIVVFYDVWPHDLSYIGKNLEKAGDTPESIEETLDLLTRLNKGYTFTNYREKMSVIVLGHATSPEQMFDSYDHELKHVVEHISNYYDVDPKSERAAYLQGEIARQMFPALAMVVCPKCNRGYRSNIRVM